MQRLEDHQETLEKLEEAERGVSIDIEAAEAERDQQDLVIVTAGREAMGQRKIIAGAIDEKLMDLYERIRSQVGQGAGPLRARRRPGGPVETTAPTPAR